MSNEIAKNIAKQIVKIFPSEAEGTYFIEGQRKSATVQKSIAAKGKLLSCWRNKQYVLKNLKKQLQASGDDNDSDDNSTIYNGNNPKLCLKII